VAAPRPSGVRSDKPARRRWTIAAPWQTIAGTMLQLRPSCECCDVDLPADSRRARICSFECTFCEDCAETRLGNVCPNCGGELVSRPVRPAAKLAGFPASTQRVFKPQGCAAAGQ
jgi:hypothetical protein